MIDHILKLFGYHDGLFVLKGQLARRQPFRTLWRLQATVILHHRYNSGPYTLRENWQYSLGLAEYLDEPGEGYLSPIEAISIDIEHWEG